MGKHTENRSIVRIKVDCITTRLTRGFDKGGGEWLPRDGKGPVGEFARILHGGVEGVGAEFYGFGGGFEGSGCPEFSDKGEVE